MNMFVNRIGAGERMFRDERIWRRWDELGRPRKWARVAAEFSLSGPAVKYIIEREEKRREGVDREAERDARRDAKRRMLSF